MSGRPFTLLSAEAPTAEGPGRATFCLNEPTEAAVFVRNLVQSKPMVARIFNNDQFRAPGNAPIARTAPLASGDEVALQLVPTHAPGPTSAAPVTVLYQDPFLLAVDKPAGLLVHGDGTAAHTLTARVHGHLVRQGSAAVPQALHRLDVDTSGIVLFSLAEETQPAFDALIAGDGLTKRYYAVIEGTLPKSRDTWLTIDAPIARDRHDARRMRVGRTGKPSVTHVRTLGVKDGRSLLEVELGTGRRHQIRVHLAHLGHPLVGDTLYGGVRDPQGLHLHAHEVRLTHPVTGERLSICAPLPEQLVTFGGDIARTGIPR